jgi:hypothetical protein
MRVALADDTVGNINRVVQIREMLELAYPASLTCGFRMPMQQCESGRGQQHSHQDDGHVRPRSRWTSQSHSPESYSSDGHRTSPTTPMSIRLGLLGRDGL